LYQEFLVGMAVPESTYWYVQIPSWGALCHRCAKLLPCEDEQ